MPYLRPPALTRRVVNPLMRRLQPRGVRSLTVTGRRTGRRRSVPVLPVRVGTGRYLVAPYGESDWVRNLRAAGEGALDGHGSHERVLAHELPPDQRADVIAAYRRAAGRTVDRCFRALPDPASHPVFELEHVAERHRG